jgi:hypothetical protein
MAGPLSHIKVLDLSRVLAAPWTGQNLADLGAEVIKVERRARATIRARSARRGSRMRTVRIPANRRTSQPPIAPRIHYGRFVEAGRTGIVRRLAANCDVLLENYKVGDLARYGLAYDDVRKINPRVVYCSGHRLRPDGAGQGPARLRFHDPGHGRPDEHYRRARPTCRAAGRSASACPSSTS